jgi:hypothetical protein
MNERIKKLADQATSYADTLDVADQRIYQEIRDREFAELIVRECADLCEHESNDDEYDQFDIGQSVKAENIKTAIKQHFGVEE